jgi:putative ABC transport system permease protein
VRPARIRWQRYEKVDTLLVPEHPFFADRDARGARFDRARRENIDMTRSFRALARRPAFAFMTCAILAIGFGVNAAVFSLTRTVLLRPLPYFDPDRLVDLTAANPSAGVAFAPLSPADYVEWQQQTRTVDMSAAWRFVYFALSGTTAPIRVQGLRVEPSFFRLLGVTPALGRDFEAREAIAGRDAVIILSNGFWRRAFGADPTVIGRPITVDGARCTVVGVLPESFQFIHVLNRELDVWQPFTIGSTEREHSIQVYGRLASGASLDAARSEAAAIYASLPRDADREGWMVEVSSLAERLTMRQRPILVGLQWAVALVLVVACANVASLVLASSAIRRRDFAVRTALGATRWRIARDFAGETMILSLGGGAGGAMLAVLTVAVLNRFVSYQDINRLEPFRIDAVVLAAVALIVVFTAIILAVLPVHTAATTDVIDALKSDSHAATKGTGLLRRFLLVPQLAVSIVLLAAALTLVRGMLGLLTIDRGLRPDRVMTAQVSLSATPYDNAAQLTRFAGVTLDRLAVMPGIESASLANYLPLSSIGTTVPIAIDGRTDLDRNTAQRSVRYWVVSPQYLSSLGIRLLAGRDFTNDDVAGRVSVTIVSARLARRFWNRVDVVGERLTPQFPQGDAFWIPRREGGSAIIVGVVADIREDGLPTAGLPQLYLPYAQNPTRIMTLMVRTAAPPETAAPLLRDAVRAADPDQPTFDERTMHDVVRETFARPRDLAWLLSAFAALALLLTTIGVYGLTEYTAVARLREIGIRMAIGATRRDIVRLVIGDAMRVTIPGVIVGVLGAPAAFTLIDARIYGIPPWNPIVLVTVSLFLGSVSVLAAAVPAHRAVMRGNPTVTLRDG